MRCLAISVLMSLPALAAPSLEGSWNVEGMYCGGKPVPKKVSQSYTKPNSIVFRFEKNKAVSEWRSKKCLYTLSYDTELGEPGKLKGSLSGKPKCEPKNCVPNLCEASLPKIQVTYLYKIEKKKLTISSQTGLECLTQGLPSPAEFRFRKAGP